MDKKKILWNVISVLLAVFTVWAVIAQDKHFKISYLVAFIASSDKLFLTLAFFTMCGYFFFEGYALSRMSHQLGFGGSKTGIIYGAADVYFSAITPSATGGQPATALYMIRDGIPGAAATAMILMNLIMYTLSIIIVGGCTFLTSFDLFIRLSILSKVLIVSGLIIITSLGIIFLLLLCKSQVLYHICDRIILFLGKIRLFKRTDHYRERLNTIIAEYEECSNTIRGHKGLIIEVFILNMLQRISYIATVVFIYLSAGYGFETVTKVWHIQSYTVLGSNCIPIPGAMGVADYIMLDGYGLILGSSGVEAEMEIICRGISFYSCIFICGAILLGSFIIRKTKERNEKC